MITVITKLMFLAGIKDVVTDVQLGQRFSKLFFEAGINVIAEKDLRSAAFYAYGKAQNENKCVALLVEDDYISNCYTALVEAHFQSVNIIVLSLCKDLTGTHHEFLSSCIDSEFYVNSDSSDEYILKLITIALEKKHPVIINLYDDEKSNLKQITNVSKIIECACSAHVKKIFSYVSSDHLYPDEISVSQFDARDSYGAVSKYMGYILGCDDKCMLILNEDNFICDLNILNNQYLDNKFKVAVFSKNRSAETKCRNWILQNKIQLSDIYSYDKEKIIESLKSENPEILWISCELEDGYVY